MSNTSKIVVAVLIGFVAGAATMFVVGAMLAFLTLQYTVPQSQSRPQVQTQPPLPDAR